MTAIEVVAILDDLQSNRLASIKALMDHIAPLNDAGAVAVLGKLENYDRSQAVEAIKLKLPINLTADQIAPVLEGTGSNRLAAIKSLNDHIGILDAQGTEAVLGNLNGYDRFQAIQTLAKSGHVARGLTNDDVKLILGDIRSNQTEGLAALSPYVQ